MKRGQSWYQPASFYKSHQATMSVLIDTCSQNQTKGILILRIPTLTPTLADDGTNSNYSALNV